MSQQPLDLRRSMRIVRRYRVLVGAVVILGIICGAGYAVLRPPMRTAVAVVVLPQAIPATQAGQAAADATGTGTGTTPYMATQVLIADSTPVLTGALPRLNPSPSLSQLRGDVQTSAPTPYTVSISVKGKTAADAEATASAVAASYVAYIGSSASPMGPAPAKLLESPATATGVSLPVALIAFGLAGAAAGAFIGVVVALTIGRKDRRLRERDAIANAIGVPVLASVSAGRPRDVAGWTALLANYRPGVVQEWRLRKALQQLGVTGRTRGEEAEGEGCSIAVLSLASDPRALTVGPQLAAFGASMGLRTTLVVGPQQDPAATATLHAACAAQPPRAGLRAVAGGGAGGGDGASGSDLTVVVVVLDGGSPRMPAVMRTTSTVLGVSAGAATAEQLARVAVSAIEDGRDVAGVVVADPEPGDHTTGQIPRLRRPGRRAMPTRLNGKVSENRR